MSAARTVVLVCSSLLAVAALDANAQKVEKSATFAPARLWDNKTPDFRGIWQARGTAHVNIEGHRGEKGVAASPSIVIDPPDGKIPYKPEALAQRDKNYAARATADPSLKCYQAGVPRATYVPTPLQILQGPGGTLAILYQENHAFRVFYPDTRPHFDAADFWMGDTRYRWEGDTLVASVVALTDQMWMDGAGNFHSPDVHIVERYRMTDADTIDYEARIEDPAVYVKPWTLKTVLERVQRRDVRIIEDECLEGEDGVRYHISPSDPRNLLKTDYSRWMNAPKE